MEEKKGNTVNRDIKRMYKKHLQTRSINTTEWNERQWANYSKICESVKKEYMRIYNSNPSMDKMNCYCLKVMFVINRQENLIPFHLFGIEIEL